MKEKKEEKEKDSPTIVVWHFVMFREIVEILNANLINYSVESGYLMGERYYEIEVSKGDYNKLKEATIKARKRHEALYI